MNQEECWLLQEKYQGVISNAFHTDCRRLRAGEPLGYVIGHVPFLQCIIHLDSRPLIPRPETEYWTEKFITTINHQYPTHILDICAGSGCSGVAIARAYPSASITFAELDQRHLSTINKNIACNLPTTTIHHYHVVHTDMFSELTGTFTHIVCNPPYIDPALDRTSDSVRRYEPAMALYGGAQGLDVIAKLINSAPHFLEPGGTLWFEHEPEQTSTITKLVKASSFLTHVTHTDQYQTPRFTVCYMAL